MRSRATDAAVTAGAVGFLAPVRAGGREDLHRGPAEEGQDLLLGPADRGGGGDDLGASPLAVPAEVVDRRLVEAGDGAEGAGDQVQLVLDDEIGR